MNKSKLITLFGFGSLAAIIGASIFVNNGCVSVQISDPEVCDSQPISWPIPTLPAIPSTVPACGDFSATLPSTSTTATFDFSGDISKISKFADGLSVVINKLLIDNSNANFTWVSGVNVSIASQTLPQMELATYTRPDAGQLISLNVNVVMSPENVLKYLSSGPVVLTFTLEPSTVSGCEVLTLANMDSIFTTVDLCVSVEGTFNKSL
jgi:hypothetical protein